MPRIKIIICSGVCLLYFTALSSQVPPKNKALSNVVGYQVYHQKLWSIQQQPKNSVLYQYSSKYIYHRDPSPATSLHLFPLNISADHSLIPRLNTFERLQSNLQTSRFEYYKSQKQGWWRDPSKGTGALILKDVLFNSNSFIHQ